MKERTLITGFGPFGDIKENPAAILAEASGRPFAVIEVAYLAADDFLSKLDLGSFDRLIMLGVAAGRDHLSIELFARNWKGDAKDVREEGAEGLIEAGAPLLLEGTLWTAENASQIVAFDPRVRISMDAGSYLCNYTYFRALQHISGKRVGFLHVASQEKMSIEIQMLSLQKILEVIEA